MEHRIARRAAVRLDVDVATVLANGPGVMTDLSETGAKIEFDGAAPGDRITLLALGQDVCGTVAWAEPDRFGLKFDRALQPGPLHAFLTRQISPPPRRTTFGRRAA